MKYESVTLRNGPRLRQVTLRHKCHCLSLLRLAKSRHVLAHEATVSLYQKLESIRALTVTLDVWLLLYRILCAQIIKVLEHIVRTIGTQLTMFVTKMAFFQWNMEV